jgi:hypothetical protein
MNRPGHEQQTKQADQSGFQRRQGHTPAAGKGLAYFPISDLQYDVITIVHQKAKALQAYDKYMRDALANPELYEILEEIVADDRRHIERIKSFLGKC